MDVILLALVLVGLAAFVAAPLYSTGATAALPQSRPPPDPTEAALEDLEIDRASGLYDEAGYTEELRTLRERRD